MQFQSSSARRLTAKGKDTHTRILASAAKLFAENGFEMTSFARISEASEVPIGSITHLFGDKAGLAECIYADAMNRLVATVTRAISQYPTHIQRTVDAIIAGYTTWAEQCPLDGRLVRVLAEHARSKDLSETNFELEAVLTAWSQPLISAGLLLPLTGPQLYAVILAPMMSWTPIISSSPEASAIQDVAWAEILSNAALGAIMPNRHKSPTVKVASNVIHDRAKTFLSNEPAKQGQLF